MFIPHLLQEKETATLQYSFLGRSMGRGDWRATVPRNHEESDTTERARTHRHICLFIHLLKDTRVVSAFQQQNNAAMNVGRFTYLFQDPASKSFGHIPRRGIAQSRAILSHLWRGGCSLASESEV